MFFLDRSTQEERLSLEAGGKAWNLAALERAGLPVPEWVCLPAHYSRQGRVDATLRSAIEELLQQKKWTNEPLAVRSSGIEEDSLEASFAGMFSSDLEQVGIQAVVGSIERCWASVRSERAQAYRAARGKSGEAAVAVILQKMVQADVAGVLFTRNPIDPMDRDSILIEAVSGLAEGLVSGAREPDRYWISRETGKIRFEASPESIGTSLSDQGVLTPALASELADLAHRIETFYQGQAQDVEWAIEKGKIYLVQSRPITVLPLPAFYMENVKGKGINLWDNSNIVESFSGVTSPFTFSFASYVYREVYRQFAEMMEVPPAVIEENEHRFRNMLGLVRGRIYYNLIHWYRLLTILPGAGQNAAFMETMMGVKKSLSKENQHVFDFLKEIPKYSVWIKLKLSLRSIDRFLRRKSIIAEFKREFNSAYEEARKIDFKTLSIESQLDFYHDLENRILKRWQAPIVNDFLCMIFFGTLKKLCLKWVRIDSTSKVDLDSLQNDLLCGQGDLESTEPTKFLMRIAAQVDGLPAEDRAWFLASPPRQVWDQLQARLPSVHEGFKRFLDRYGFRCVNELKLEENDLHDDPSFVVGAVQGYVKVKSYSIEAMQKREKEIRSRAEVIAFSSLSGIRRWIFIWVLERAREAVRTREDLRFDRTKIYGVIRKLVRGVGHHFHRLGLLENPQDVFYLTLDEIVSFREGRHGTNEFRVLTQHRKSIFDHYRKSSPPPERFYTVGAVGASFRYVNVLTSSDLLADALPKSDDPNTLVGVPCCPGVVEGTVRVVHDIRDAEGIAGEILVTSRTDPGWVPLYPSCSGLLIERGSLLSHSAVVARELGLPTIVGISGGLMTRLKTGMRVRMDASRGEVKIL